MFMKKFLTAVFAMMVLAVLAAPMQTAEAGVKFTVESLELYDGRAEAYGYFTNDTKDYRTVDSLELDIEITQGEETLMTLSTVDYPGVEMEAYYECYPYTVVIEGEYISRPNGRYRWHSHSEVHTSVG